MTPTHIKICGITQIQQAQEISRLGVGTLGYILHKPSLRYIQPEQIRKIINQVENPFCRHVGVVVNSPVENLVALKDETNLDLFQLHGDESPEYCRELTTKNIPWIKSFRVKAGFDFGQLELYPSNRFLLDAWAADSVGGTGICLDWKNLAQVTQKYKIILAGGLNAENIALAIQTCQPAACDISSGVEIRPGYKSLEAIHQVLKALL